MVKNVLKFILYRYCNKYILCDKIKKNYPIKIRVRNQKQRSKSNCQKYILLHTYTKTYVYTYIRKRLIFN